MLLVQNRRAADAVRAQRREHALDEGPLLPHGSVVLMSNDLILFRGAVAHFIARCYRPAGFNM